MRTNHHDTDNTPKPVTGILTAHCNTFVHVDILLSTYLISHLSENCKQYTVKYIEKKHMFLQNILFSIV